MIGRRCPVPPARRDGGDQLRSHFTSAYLPHAESCSGSVATVTEDTVTAARPVATKPIAKRGAWPTGVISKARGTTRSCSLSVRGCTAGTRAGCGFHSGAYCHGRFSAIGWRRIRAQASSSRTLASAFSGRFSRQHKSRTSQGS